MPSQVWPEGGLKQRQSSLKISASWFCLSTLVKGFHQETSSPYQQSDRLVYPITYSLLRGENRWIYAFGLGISAKWKANSFFQDLNSDRQVLS